MVLQLPLPETLIQWTWFLIGFFFARGFGKQLDQDIQESEWFKSLPNDAQWILKRLLDSLHHLWIGMLLMVYGPKFFPEQKIEFYWFGYGIFIDDLPDLPKRFREYFKYIVEHLGNH